MSNVTTPATVMPVRLSSSCAPDPRICWESQTDIDRARSPAAGTVVTEMKTPTSAFERPAVWDSTPAQPASTATTADHLSGRQMKPVSGLAPVTSTRLIQSDALASSASSVVTTMAKAKPFTRRRRDMADQCSPPQRQADCESRDDAELRADNHGP